MPLVVQRQLLIPRVVCRSCSTGTYRFLTAGGRLLSDCHTNIAPCQWVSFRTSTAVNGYFYPHTVPLLHTTLWRPTSDILSATFWSRLHSRELQSRISHHKKCNPAAKREEKIIPVNKIYQVNAAPVIAVEVTCVASVKFDSNACANRISLSRNDSTQEKCTSDGAALCSGVSSSQSHGFKMICERAALSAIALILRQMDIHCNDIAL